MRRQELEARKREIIREMRRLEDDLGGLEDEIPDEEIGGNQESIGDLYIPRGLRNIHRLPKPML